MVSYEQDAPAGIQPARRARGAAPALGWPALLLVLMALCAYTYWIPRGLLSNSDSHIALTRAIVDDHTLRIDRYAVGLADRSGYQGHFYTDKAPGLSLLSIPAYVALRLALPSSFFGPDLFFVARYLLTALTLSVPAALFVGLLWRFLVPVLGRRRAALLAIGYAFGTMAWALSVLLFSHIITAMCLFGAFMLLYPASIGRQPVTPWRWALAGGLCGLAVLCEYPAALVAALVALFAAHTARRAGLAGAIRVCLLFAIAGLAALVPLAVYNTLVYGSPLSQGYAHLHGAAQFIKGMHQGIEGIGLPNLAALWGITFSPYRGLFLLSPFLLLALPGLVLMWRRREQRAAALLCLGAVAVMLLFNSAYAFWDGGVSLGPRHFSPALPFLLFPVAFALRRRPWSRLAPWLIAVSVGIVTLCCVTVVIFLPGVQDPIPQLAIPHLLHGPTPNSWGVLLGLHGVGALAPLAAMEAALGVALWRRLSPAHRRRMAPRPRALATPAPARGE